MVKSHWISDLHWVRSTQQTRGQQTQEKILEAAEKLFSEKGVQDTSMADISKEAGCSVGAVYHHFRDKTALTHALLKLISDQISAFGDIAMAPERWEGASIQDIVNGFLELSFAMLTEMPWRKRAKFEIIRQAPEVQHHFNELNEKIHDKMFELLYQRRAQINHPSPETAIHFALDQLHSMIEAKLNSEVFSPENSNYSNEEFIDESIRSVEAYLQLTVGG